MRFLQVWLLLFGIAAAAQNNYTILASFPQAAGKEVRLSGFAFPSSILFSDARADAAGNFKLNYPGDYSGAALLEVKGTTSVILLLNKENFTITWSNLSDYNTIAFENSAENNVFNNGLELYKKSNSKQMGLAYLIPLYNDDKQKQQFFQNELHAEAAAMDAYLKTINANSYSKYYLQLRSLLSDLKQSSSGSGLMKNNELEFQNLDFGDIRLQRSGLLSDLLDSYFVLAEMKDQNESHINSAIDLIMSKLDGLAELKQDVAEHLFKFFETRSLFAASEHVAISMLNNTDCTIDGRRQALFEQYRRMAKGKVAPEIMLVNSNKPFKKLSDVPSSYKLVIFGAGWCPTCQQEIPKLLASYPKWKEQNLEVVYISLDTDSASFNTFAGKFPWVTSSDFKSWEGAAPRDYFVSGTPTMYLLDKSATILLKPVSPDQVSAWLDAKR